MERVGDHAENIAELAEEMEREEITFSNMALDELSEMTKVTLASYENALKALENNDITYAMKTAVLEEQVDALEKKLRASHIDRLSNADVMKKFSVSISWKCWAIWNVFPTMQ